MQTAVRKRAADFDFWGDTPTPEFCENSHERGPRSPAGTAQGFDPPLGPHRNAAGAARAVCAGVKRAAAHWRRCASAGAGRAVFAGAARARRSAGRRGGRFRARGAGAFLPGGGGKPGAGGLGRVRRTKAAWRARRRGAGTWPGSAARAVFGAFRGGSEEGAAGGGRGAARPGRLPVAGARRAAARKNGCTQRGLCRVPGHLCDRGGRRAKKPVFAL